MKQANFPSKSQRNSTSMWSYFLRYTFFLSWGNEPTQFGVFCPLSKEKRIIKGIYAKYVVQKIKWILHFCFCRLVTPCWSVLYFWQINLEISSSMNWIFSLFQTWFLQAKIQFVELHFSYMIFQNSSTDQQGVWAVGLK